MVSTCALLLSTARSTEKLSWAEQQGAVGLARGDELGGGDGDARVGGVTVGVDPDIDDGRDDAVGLEVGLDDLLVVEPGVIRADDDAQCVGH
jgi:hypothetical protein